MLRLLPLALLAFFCVAAPAQPPSGPPQPNAEDAGAIRAVIEAQLEAFQMDDEEKAFSYASPGIREKFKTAAEFMAMVRESYRALYRPRLVHFLPAAVIGGEIVQAVRVVGPDGEVKVALYSMEKQPAGSWKIRACDLAPSTAVMT